MEQQKTSKALKEDILALLQKAQETKETSTSDAITILYDAAKLLPSLVSDNDKTSERVLTQDNSTQEVLYLSKRGNILYELKDYEGAAKCYKEIIVKVPKSYEMIRAYGDCLRKQEKHDEAINQYKIALTVCDKDDFSTPAEKAGLLNSRGLSYIGLKDYQKALADFDEAIKLSEKNPLYHCNKGHAAYALGDKENKEIAMTHFKRANELVKSGDLGDLTKDNIGYIDKTLEEFINKLEELDQIPLEIEDHIMTRRVTKYVAGIVRQISLKGNEEVITASKTSLREQGNELETAKKKLSYVKKDLHLRHYYDGFVYKLSESFITSVNVMSETFVLDTGSTPLSILTTAISLLPLVGDQLSQGIESIYTFVKERSVKKAAANITQCASSIGEFEELAQDIVCEVILKREAKIKELKDADVEAILLPNWASRFQPVINKIHKLGQDLDVFWNGERNKKPLQKLGYSTAINLVSETISKEEYWKPDDVIDLDVDVKKQKLVESALKIMDDLFDSTKKLVPPPIQKGVPNKADKGTKAHKKDKSDCQLF